MVVDDEKDLAELVAYNLEKEGWAVEKAHDGLSALKRAPQADLVVLDLMLPGLDGLEVCRRLRKAPETRSLPILMLTARAGEGDKVLGLEIGADDYLSKPFSTRELVARVRALLRRREDSPPAPVALKFEGLEIEAGSHEVKVAGMRGRPELTALEFRLLLHLARRPGMVFSRAQLLAGVWNLDGEMETRTVDVHVRRLREKLGPAGAMIKTLRGAGYKFSGASA